MMEKVENIRMDFRSYISNLYVEGNFVNKFIIERSIVGRSNLKVSFIVNRLIMKFIISQRDIAWSFY